MLSIALTSVFYAFIAFSHSVEAGLVQAPLINSTFLNNTTLDPLFNTTMFAPGTEPGMYSSNFSRLVMFGDSLSDNGNGSRVLSNGTTPDPRIYWNYRWSNGPVWVEDLAERLNVTLIDYATGGATVNSTRTPAVVDEVTCLHVPSALEQIEAFVKKANSSLDRDAMEYTLFAIWIGANDIITMVDSDISVTGAEIVDDIFVGIEKLKAVGAKHFLLNSIPDIGRTPFGSHVGEKAASVLTDTTLDLRKALFSVVDTQTVIARNMSSMDARMVLSNGIVVADMFRAADEIYQHPLSYGLSKTKRNQSCVHGQSAFELKYVIPVSLCTDSDVHFFWDSMHLTRKVHSLFAKAAAASLLKAGWISQR